MGCAVHAKPIAMVVQHGILLVGCWVYADHSLTAAKIVRREATCLVGAIRIHVRLVEALAASRRCLTAGYQIDHRQRKPSLFQLLTDPTLGGLA